MKMFYMIYEQRLSLKLDLIVRINHRNVLGELILTCQAINNFKK